MSGLFAHNLSCRRGGRGVFRGVSFVLEAGGALVAMGTNGSGKSSLLRGLAGLLPFAGGTLRWQGKALNTGDEAWRRRVRYIGHLDAVKPEWTINETLAYWRDLGRMTLTEDPFAVLSDGGGGGRLVRFLSAGQKRKLALTRLCLVGDESESLVWLLDEPTTALDCEGQKTLVDLVERHREGGGLAVIASHEDISLAHSQRFILSV